MTQPEFRFDGADIVDIDHERLTGQLADIYTVMADHRWRTVDTIVNLTGHPANSVQAQLRNLRKSRFGGYEVEKRRVTETGLYEYRVGEPHVHMKPATKTYTITVTQEDAEWMVENRYLAFDAFQQLRKALGA